MAISPFFDCPPELVVEVISPETGWTETIDKISEYFSVGVKEIWIVEPGSRKINVCHDLDSMTRFSRFTNL